MIWLIWHFKILGNYAYQAYLYIERKESLSHTLICIYVYNALLDIPYHYLRLVDEIFGHSDHGHDCRLRTSFRGIGHGLAMAYPPWTNIAPWKNFIFQPLISRGKMAVSFREGAVLLLFEKLICSQFYEGGCKLAKKRLQFPAAFFWNLDEGTVLQKRQPLFQNIGVSKNRGKTPKMDGI